MNNDFFGNSRTKEAIGHAVAFLMLALSLFALYSHTLYLAIIPLLWMAFRVGKEQGREQAHHDIEQAASIARLIHFPDSEESSEPPALATTRRAQAQVAPFTHH